MRLSSEKDLLDIKVRKAIIEEIVSNNNRARKDKAYKWYNVYKDQVKPYVRKELLQQFAIDTVNQMSYCMSNIGLVRKIVDKLARVYNAGVTRKIPNNDDQTKSLEKLADLLKVDKAMTKTNRVLKLQRNVMLFPKPCPITEDNSTEKYKLKLEVLNPYQYDILEDQHDTETPMAMVLSNYLLNSTSLTALHPESRANHALPFSSEIGKPVDNGDNGMIANPSLSENAVMNMQTRTSGARMEMGIVADQARADEQDLKKRAAPFIFWSKNYHFTCDHAGELIQLDPTKGKDAVDTANPIKMFPGIPFSLDQDGGFWALGGDDLVDAGVLVNSLITQVYHIAVVQGYGQMFMTGKGLPKSVTVGPQICVMVEQKDKDDPAPTFGFASANAPLAELIKSVEMYVALILTTNNLSTTGVSTNFERGQQYPSGIAMLIDKAESMEDVKDQQGHFVTGEKETWKIIFSWMQFFRSAGKLSECYSEVKEILPTTEVTTTFNQPQVIQSEAEKIGNIKLRQELPEKINERIEYIMMDNPSLTREEAELKLQDILEEEIQAKAQAVIDAQNSIADPNVDPAGNPIDPNAKPLPTDQQKPPLKKKPIPPGVKDGKKTNKGP